MSTRRPPAFVVIAGGELVTASPTPPLPEHRYVIAADSGLDRAAAMGIEVDLVVGDLDSVSEVALARAIERGLPIERHPRDKDAIDLDLAIDAALARGGEHLVIVASTEGRLDQALAGLLVLGAPRLADVSVEAWIGEAYVRPVRSGERVELQRPVGTTLSLVPLHGGVEGVTTGGLTFPLVDEPLPAATTRGISNSFLETTASVFVRRGVLLVIVPGDAPR